MRSLWTMIVLAGMLWSSGAAAEEPAQCFRRAACQCWQGCVLARQEPGPVRLHPEGQPLTGDWYRLLDTGTPDDDAFLVRSPVCLIDDDNQRVPGSCFDALDMSVCTGSCYPVAPGYSCAPRPAGETPTSCEKVIEPPFGPAPSE